jgi:hypothetical protein
MSTLLWPLGWMTPRRRVLHKSTSDEMRDRFDRAYAARKVAGHSDPARNGLWVSLYHEEAKSPANRVGAGAGLKHPPIARVPLLNGSGGGTEFTRPPKSDTGQALTIQEAKERVARALGLDPSCVKITIEA